MTQTIIRLATTDDLAALGTIGPAAYTEAYSYLWSRPSAYAKQLASFSSIAFGEFLNRPDTRVWVAEMEHSVIGFLTMVLGSEDPIERRPGGAEVPRIYLLGPARGAGLGRELLDAAISEAIDEGSSHLWLDAMDSASWAWRTYEKWGFGQIGVTHFEKGVSEDLSGMVVMVKELC